MTNQTSNRKRRFIDAPSADRCMADVVYRDGSLAQCGRHKRIGDYCKQHAVIKEAIETLPTRQLEDFCGGVLTQRDGWASDELLRRSRFA